MDQQDQERKDPTEDLELSEDEAGSVKGGVNPIEGGDSGATGFSLSSISWRMRRKSAKKKKSSSAGGRPV